MRFNGASTKAGEITILYFTRKVYWTGRILYIQWAPDNRTLKQVLLLYM